MSSRWRKSEILVAALLSLPLSADPACPLTQPADVFRCALKHHPAILRQENLTKQGELLEDVAGQRPNPELGSRVVYGKSQGDSILNTELSLLHTIELGGKRSARIGKASAEQESRLASLLHVKEEVFIDTVKRLYRLRQAQAELHVVEEALGKFSRIVGIFRSRPRLGPEQQVSFSVIQLADGDYKLKKARLQSEIGQIEIGLALATNGAFHTSPGLLPPRKIDWPEILNSTAAPKGSEIRVAEAQVRAALADKADAESGGWPDLKIGPAVELQRQGDVSYQTYGAALSIPLPLFQANGAGKTLASAGLESAEKSRSLREAELKSERMRLHIAYRSSVNALQASATVAAVEEKHKNLEGLFNRGLIPAPLLIEAHRQILDFTQMQNELELLAVEALAMIQAIDGNLFEANP